MAKLLFGVHNHQPVENFKHIVDEAVEKAYRPFIETVYPVKKFKFAVHFSGWLLKYVAENHPDVVELLRSMAREGRVEFFTAGYYEPVLVSLPSRWRRYQIERLNNLISELFGQKPKGLWLTERVWDDSVICDIVDCGIEYVVVDDYHFICAGFDRSQLGGYFLTESEGKTLKVFPIDKKLRYLVPFKPPSDTAGYLQSAWGSRTLFDDGEKFGIWPGTYSWVYEKGWLKEFLSLVESGEIEMELFRENAEREKPLGIAYLPTASYYEMGEWTLPAERFKELKELESFLKERGLEPYIEKFVRGSIWKNFFVKYPESNYMHKRMLTLSLKGEDSERFRDNIAKAQCNDVFWHGIFGGIYLPNLRDNFWRFLLTAQEESEREKKYVRLEDVNFDGYREGILSSETLFAVVLPKEGGILGELSLKKEKFNYQNLISRHREGYHYFMGAVKEKGSSRGIATIHERPLKIPEEIRKKLAFDWHLRGSFVSHFTDSINDEAFFREEFRELSDFANTPYSISLEGEKIVLERKGGIYTDGKFPAELRKEFLLKGNALSFSEHFKTGFGGELLHILEFNFHFLNPGGFKLNSDGKVLKIEDTGLRKVIKLTSSRPFTLLHYPVETVSQSEKGAELTVQGHCFGLVFPFKESFSLTIDLEVKDV